MPQNNDHSMTGAARVMGSMDVNQAFEMLKQLPPDQQEYVCDLIDFLTIWEQRGLDKYPIMELRRQAGLTQRELAELAGVSTRTISRIEGGMANPDAGRRLRQFIQVFRFERDRLLGRLFRK